MNQLQPASQPPKNDLTTPFSAPWLDTLRRGVGTMNGQPMLPSGFSISEGQRRELDSAIAQYRARLAPASDNHRMTAVVLAKLLAAFPAPAQSDAPVEQRMDAYFEALHGIPAWAVDEARKAIIAGKVPDLSGVWAPTPPQLAKVARMAMERDQRVLVDLERIAAAKQFEDIDQRASRRIADGFDRLRADLIADRLKPAEVSP